MITEFFGKGAVRDTYDVRDYHYAPKGAYDWETGFDIEEKLGCKLITKDQNGSYSCGGQAWSYYGEVLEALSTIKSGRNFIVWVAPIFATIGALIAYIRHG